MTRKTGASADLGQRPVSTWKAALFVSAFAAASVLPLSTSGASSPGGNVSGAPAGCSGNDLYVCATSVPLGDPGPVTAPGCSGNDLYVCATSVPRG